MSTTQNSPLGVRGSKHNIIVPVKDSGDYFIVNPLYKSADFVSAEELNFLQNGLDANGEFSERNYLVEENEEKRAFKLAYLDFIDTREEDEIQLFFVPNYSCNFACSYCYQEGYSPAESKMTTEVVDAFFNYIGTEFTGRKKYITVFGGEPLLPGESQRKIIEYLLQKSSEAKLDVAFVTN